MGNRSIVHFISLCLILLALALTLLSGTSASTTISLQTANVENLDDSWVNSQAPTNGYASWENVNVINASDSIREAYIRFNISSIPANAVITNSTLTFWIRHELFEAGEWNNYSTHRVYPTYYWTEEAINWNNKPTTSEFNTTPTDIVNINDTYGNLKYVSWDVTSIISTDYNDGYGNTSILLKGVSGNSNNAELDHLELSTKEETTDVSYRPRLNITYNYIPTFNNDLSFLNISSTHIFNVTASFNDTDGAEDINSVNITTSSGVCTQLDNSSISNTFTVVFNCSGTPLVSTNINITVYDSANYSNTSSTSSNSYPNIAPSITSVEINDSTPDENANINCTYSGETDTDGDTIYYNYDWYQDGISQSINNSILGAGNTTAGENWKCSVTPTDTYENGSKVFSAEVSIGTSNVAPVITSTNAIWNNIESTISNPTNNDTLINFSVIFTDGNPVNNWTAYFCEDNEANSSGCVGTTFCTSEVNSTLKNLSCNYDVGGVVASNDTFYVFVIDNSSLVSASSSRVFHINHVPSTPTLSSPTNGSNDNDGTVEINFASTDSDSDVINYTIYASPNGTTYSLIYDGAGAYNYTPGSDGKYYVKALAYDEHNYNNSINSSTYNFYVDTTPPIAQNTSISATSGYTTNLITITIDSIDETLNVSSGFPKMETYDFNLQSYQNYTMDLSSGNTYLKSFTFGVVGTYNISFFVEDDAGNKVILRDNFTFVASIQGGSGGGTAPRETLIITENLTASQLLNITCGNRVCDKNENPLTCPSDCPLNIDVLLSGKLFKEYWFANILFVIVGIAMVYVVITIFTKRGGITNG